MFYLRVWHRGLGGRCRCQAFRCFAPPGGKDWQFALNHATCMLSIHVQTRRTNFWGQWCQSRVYAKVIFERILLEFFGLFNCSNIYSYLLSNSKILPLPVAALSLVSCRDRWTQVWFLHSSTEHGSTERWAVFFFHVMMNILSLWLCFNRCSDMILIPYTSELVLLLTFL